MTARENEYLYESTSAIMHGGSNATGYNKQKINEQRETEGFPLQTISHEEPWNSVLNVNTGKDKHEDQISTAFLDEHSTDDQKENVFYDASSFPDGGFKAYTVVFGSFMGLVPVFGLINSLGAIESYISHNQLSQVRPSTISWIFSIYLSVSFVSCVFAGAYFDRNGGLKPMLFGTLFYVGGIMAMANSYKVYHFILAFSLCCGLGTGICTTPLVSCVSTWFYHNRATATSLATIGGSIGGIVFPIMLRKLYEKVGFEWAIRILGFICLFCLLMAAIFAQERKDPNHKRKEFENKKELVSWYFTTCFNWRYFLEGKFLFATLGAALAENSLTSSATYLASYSLLRGNSETTSYALITVTNAVGILGRYIPAFLADKYVGTFNIVIITVSMAAFWNFVLWLPFGGNTACLWVYVCLYGFSAGSILSLTPVCIGAISKTSDFGKRYSTTYLAQAVITIPVIPISGVIIGDGNHIKGYNHFIVFSTMFMVAGALCYLTSRYLCVGTRLCKF